MSAINPGELIDGRYKVVSRIGAGGMADVFLAQDEQLGRQVALKLLHRRFAEDPGFVERFRREAQAAGSLQHPNVVSVYDRGSFDGTYYIAMEYLNGRSLKLLIRQEAPLDPVRAIDLTIQILKATRFAHRRGVIHRDLKPHNVIVDENDHVKVTDFGIARAGASDMTETGSIMGTAQYLSPEQAQGHAVSEASDLYSIGIVLYELLTGRVPFDAESAVTIALKHVAEAPLAPRRINPAIPEPLEQVVLWALNKNPADRPTDAEQFISVLEQVREAIVSGATGQVTASMPAVTAGALTAIAVPTRAMPAATALALYGAGPPPVLDQETGPPHPNGGGRPDDGGRSPWVWVLVVVLILLVLAGGGVAAYLLTRPAKVIVPNVVLLQQSQAQTEVQNDGFTPAVIPETSNAPAGEVIAQSPLGGAKVKAGSIITLTVSQGPGDVNVPSVANLPEKVALRQIKNADLVLEQPPVGESSTTIPKGYAIETSPAAGAQIQKGSAVTLFVSTGRAAVNVPTVTGDTEDAARSQLSGAGFTVASTTQTTTTASPGNVVGQSPNGGVSAAYGSGVTITVASAPTTASVPNVIGFTSPAARSTLTADGFKVTSTTQDVTKQNKDGIVISQTPNGGSTQNKGSQVAIVVGSYVATGPTHTTTRPTTSPSTTTTTTTTATTPNLNPTTTTTPTTTPSTTTTSTSTATTPTTTNTTTTTTSTTP